MIGTPETAEPLGNLAVDSVPEVRSCGLAALIWLFHSPDGGAHVAARATLVGLGPRSVEALIAALRGGATSIRNSVPDVLWRIKDSRVLGALIMALSDPNAPVQTAAASALGFLKDPRALNRRTSLTLPTGEVTTYGYDNDSHITSLLIMDPNRLQSWLVASLFVLMGSTFTIFFVIFHLILGIDLPKLVQPYIIFALSTPILHVGLYFSRMADLRRQDTRPYFVTAGLYSLLFLGLVVHYGLVFRMLDPEKSRPYYLCVFLGVPLLSIASYILNRIFRVLMKR